MNVLVCDDDPSTRHVLKRLLARQFGCSVDEADNGLDALDKMSRTRYDVLMLDVHMPVMDGVETLETIRESPAFAKLPVIVLTGEKDEDVVRQLIALGVSDFILKPPNPERVTARFERLQKQLGTTAQGSGVRDEIAAPSLREGDRIILADGDGEYRQLFEKALGSLFKVVTVETGAQALDATLQATTTAVFLGRDLGMLSADRLAKKLRSAASARPRVFGVVPRGDLDATRLSGQFDDVLARSFVTSTITADVRKLMQPASCLAQFQAVAPPLRSSLISAAEQMFGMMLKTDVETLDQAPPRGEDRLAFARVDMPVGAFLLKFKFRYDFGSGRYMAAAFLEDQPDNMTADEIESVAGEISNVITGRLHGAYQRAQLTSRQGLPTLGTESAAALGAEPVGVNTVHLFFRAIEKPIVFEVRVDVLQAEQAPVADVDEKTGIAMVRTAS